MNDKLYIRPFCITLKGIQVSSYTNVIIKT